jgi:CTP synthase
MARCYKKQSICERHRHRYEFNSTYLKEFQEAGMVF